MTPDVAQLLARAWCLEDGPHLEAILDELAAAVLASFRIQRRHRAVLAHDAGWGDPDSRTVLARYARVAAFEAMSREVTADDFLRTARTHLEGILDGEGGSRRIVDDPTKRVPLTAVPLPRKTDPTPLPDQEVEALDLRARLLSGETLTDGERRVVEARMELGPKATGPEVAERAGVSVGSERELTRRARKKLGWLVDNPGGWLPEEVEGGRGER